MRKIKRRQKNRAKQLKNMTIYFKVNRVRPYLSGYSKRIYHQYPKRSIW